MRRNTKAFMLVELVIVIAILGIVAVALLPKVVELQRTAIENEESRLSRHDVAALKGVYWYYNF
jgi:type II secretory pathway pseudopilin PulG